MAVSRARRRVFWVLLPLIALGVSLGAGEVALRLIYRDRGRTTLGGPGDLPFEYTFNPAGPGPEERHPQPAATQTPGVSRLAIQGDSITWGVGVKDWTRLYPSRLLEKLRADGAAWDLSVESVPGYNMDRHADHLPRLVDRFAPDVLVYQWYANDLDVGQRVDVPRRLWQQWPYHALTTQWSYLYFFANSRLDRLAPPAYQHHLRDDFGDDSPSWALFRDAFHRWATVASARVPRSILLLYPQVPFSGENPLAALHARMTALATATTRLVYPPEFQRTGDPLASDGAATSEPAPERVLARAGETPMLPGHYDVDFELRLNAPAVHPGRLLVLENRTRVLAERDIPSDVVGQWFHVSVPVDIDSRPLADLVEFRVTGAADADVSVGRVALDVRYARIEVLDPTSALNTFDTHASIFDAHPNERAHGVLADLLYERLRGSQPASTRP